MNRLGLGAMCGAMAMSAWAGDLVPTHAPDEAGSAMYTGRDLLNRLESGTNAPLRTGSFVEPTAGPTAGTMPTLNEIMAAAPATSAAAALPGEVLADKAYWGLAESDWGTRTGTMATRTLSEANDTVQAGYYAATTLSAVDANLVAANIPYGVTMFGIQGSGNPKEGMALIPAGDFFKTDSPDGRDFATNYVSAFYMSRTPITKAQWDAVRSWASTNGYTDLPVGGGKGVDHPVHTVSWYAVVKWCNARSEMEGRPPAYYTDGTHETVYRTGNLNLTNGCVAWTTNGYRLPTESEWEKAARGGLHAHRYPWGDTTNRISHAQANFNNNGGEDYQYGSTGYHPSFNTGAQPYTSPVGSFAPNGDGLYDMLGNVFGWCWDRYDMSGYYVAGSDLRGPDTGFYRVLRGGSWHSYADYCRFGYRASATPDTDYYLIGFRDVLPPGQP